MRRTGYNHGLKMLVLTSRVVALAASSFEGTESILRIDVVTVRY